MIVLKIIGCVFLGIIALILLVLSVKVRIFAEYSDVDTNVRIKWLFLDIPLYPSEKKDSKNNNQQDASEKVSESTSSSVSDEADTAATDIASVQNTVTENAEAIDNTQINQPESEAAAPTEENTNNKKGNSFLKTLYSAHGIDGLLLIVRRLFRYLGTFFGDALTSLVIDELYIDVKCNKKDAASTAIYYGEVCSSLFPMLGALVTKYKVRKYDINVYPDYLARHSSASFAVSMHIYPIYLVSISVALVVKLLFKVILKLLIKCFLPSKSKGNENIETETKESVA